MRHTVKLKSLDNEEGLISITVTMIVMALLTLIALGFASLAAREQRQALDQQLNTQAFYAAESGINEAINSNATVSDCDGNAFTSFGDASVRNTCVVINNKLSTLEYSSIDAEGAVTVPIHPDTNLNKLIINWQDKNGGSAFGSATCEHYMYDKTSWGGTTGVLRVMLMPGVFNSGRSELINRTQSLFLYPSPLGCGGTTFTALQVNDPANYQQQGVFVSGACDSTVVNRKFCRSVINVNIANTETYYLRFRPLYNSVSVTIEGLDSSGNNVKFIGAQTEIDSTGKTTDVLRRLVVRVPSTENSSWSPKNAVETTNTFCKRLFVVPGINAVTDVTGADGNGAPAFGVCNPGYTYP